jgi:hypothetical protein
MNKYLKYTLIALLVVGVFAATAVGVAYAQTEDPPKPIDALAELLGLTAEELRELIHDGSSLEELAEEAGVDLDAFWQEMQEAHEEFFRNRLDEALENGDISEEQYNWMLEGLEKGFIGGGHGMGGFKGKGGLWQGDGPKPFEDGEGPRPFGGRGGFGGRGNPGSCFGEESTDS